MFDLPFGVLDSEVRILMYFMFKCVVNDLLNETNVPTKKLQHWVHNNILNSIQSDINQLFKINKIQLQLIISTRIRFYEDIYKGKLYETNKLKFNTREDRIIYASSFVFYVLCADKSVFEQSNIPFASNNVIKKKTILQRNENYKKYGNLDKFYSDYYEILHNIYDMIFETSKEQIDTYKQTLRNTKIIAENEKKYKNKKRTNDTIADKILLYISLLFVIGFILLCVILLTITPA